jgi:hypothetical protein
MQSVRARIKGRASLPALTKQTDESHKRDKKKKKKNA